MRGLVTRRLTLPTPKQASGLRNRGPLRLILMFDSKEHKGERGYG